MSDDFHLKWHDHHDLFFSAAEHLCRGDFLTDVTLSCGGRYFSAHKLVLSVCSGYFAELFASRRAPPFTQTIVYLKDVDPVHLELILAYMYRGEISVGQAELIELLHAAKGLRVRGLTEASETDTPTLHPPPRDVNGKRKPMVVHSKKDPLAAKKMEVEDRWSGAQDGDAPDTAGAEMISKTDAQFRQGQQGGGYDDDYYVMPARGQSEYDGAGEQNMQTVRTPLKPFLVTFNSCFGPECVYV